MVSSALLSGSLTPGAISTMEAFFLLGAGAAREECLERFEKEGFLSRKARNCPTPMGSSSVQVDKLPELRAAALGIEALPSWKESSRLGIP